MPNIPRVTDCHLFPADSVHWFRPRSRLQFHMAKIAVRVTLRLEKTKVTALPWTYCIEERDDEECGRYAGRKENARGPINLIRSKAESGGREGGGEGG